jgi:hypothetical protein
MQLAPLQRGVLFNVRGGGVPDDAGEGQGGVVVQLLNSIDP